MPLPFKEQLVFCVLAGAVALGRQLGKGARVATILCDTGFRYLSTLYNAEWLRQKNLPVFPWLAE